MPQSLFKTGSDSLKNKLGLGIFQRMTTLPSHSLISSEKRVQIVEIHSQIPLTNIRKVF